MITVSRCATLYGLQPNTNPARIAISNLLIIFIVFKSIVFIGVFAVAMFGFALAEEMEDYEYDEEDDEDDK